MTGDICGATGYTILVCSDEPGFTAIANQYDRFAKPEVAISSEPCSTKS